MGYETKAGNIKLVRVVDPFLELPIDPVSGLVQTILRVGPIVALIDAIDDPVSMTGQDDNHVAASHVSMRSDAKICKETLSPEVGIMLDPVPMLEPLNEDGYSRSDQGAQDAHAGVND
jgi:hypothetical protein